MQNTVKHLLLYRTEVKDTDCNDLIHIMLQIKEEGEKYKIN